MAFTHSPGHSGGALPLPDVPPLRAALPRFAAELQRARRYEHALSVVSVRAIVPGHNGGPPPRQGAATELPSLVYVLLGSILRNTLRESDAVAAAPERLAYVAFLPETDRLGAASAVARIEAALRRVVDGTVQWGAAVFPVDGFTVDDLLAKARELMEQARARIHVETAEASNG